VSVLSLAEAKQHLNVTASDSDAEIQSTIDEAEAMVAQRCGPLEPTTVTERVAGGPGGLSLSRTPVISLTSVTPVGGTALTVSDLYVSPSGVVTYAMNAGVFYAPWYDVVYQSGRSTTPDDLLRGVKELTRNLWNSQRPSGGRFSSNAGSEVANTIPGAAYIWTFKVEQAIAPHLQSGI
jgi:hypothetical protein